jgi:hypothetical protein
MANSAASISIKPTVAFNRGDTFVFGSWVCTADGAGSFQRRLTMAPNPSTGLVTLPEVIMGDLAGKFGEISLYNQHADFEFGSASNSNSTSPWAIACEPATKPSCADFSLHEHFPYGLCNASKDHAKALTARRAGKEIVSDYTSDSNPASGYCSDSSYEFDFGSNTDFMRVDNRVAQVPPLRTREPDNHEATSRSPADNGRNRTQGELPQKPNHTWALAGGPSQGGNSAGSTGGSRGTTAHGDAGGGGSAGGSSSHRAGRRAGGGGDHGGQGHTDNHVTGASHSGYNAHRRIEEIRCKKSSTAGDNDGFPAFSARLRNLLLPEKFKPLGITKYDAKQDPLQWLRCYALSIENAGGNNDTKCVYFPFCLDQAPLTWLESLEKYSIDKWD